MEDNKLKRVLFAAEDTELLLECARKRSKIIDCNETNRIGMSGKKDVSKFSFVKSTFDSNIFQAWQKITNEFNASQSCGAKTAKQLVIKYKNLKTRSKKILSKNAREMKATGGGTARIDLSDDFGFSYVVSNRWLGKFL